MGTLTVVRRPVARIVLAALLLSACQGGGSKAAPPPSVAELTTTTDVTTTSTTSTTIETTTTTTQPLNVVPAVIDVAYAQRVADFLTHLDGEASRMLVANKGPSREFYALLESIFYGQSLDSARTTYGREAAVGFESYRTPPGDAVFKVIAVLSSSRTCIAAQADLDFRPRYHRDVPVISNGVVLLKVNLAPTDPEHRSNPSDWLIQKDGAVSGGDPSTGCQ